MGKKDKEQPANAEEEENLKVAVRVRPFNKREEARNAKCIVEMSGQSTKITNPDDKSDEKTFAFDYSYWSFDGCKDRGDGYQEPDGLHANGKKFVDQKKVFDDLGRGILNNAWKGFNTSLFAYGQTGSGKSWSVFGYGVNKGVVPVLAEELFKDIEKQKDAGIEFEVKFSMLEIYNEVARDLLDPNGAKKKGGLKIRQHPKRGFYADGLKEVFVKSYEDISARIDEGTVNRTVASTNMNATSSRAHTISGIRFTQKQKNDAGKEMEKRADINLVDLAGSERVESTGAQGDRLKEGAKINMSLSSLGNVIHALAKQSEGDTKVKVPYRDSALTKLLQNALGGNSKTIMIAAISPADINFEESLSTLRYADRAKQIKTKAIVNEDPTEALIRELREENERLKARMKDGDVNEEDLKDLAGKEVLSKDELEDMKKKWLEEMKANMKANEKAAKDKEKTTEQKVQEQASKDGEKDSVLAKVMEEKKSKAHLFNLNFDPQLSGRLVHIFQKPETEIGNQKGKESDICMVGPGVHEAHAFVKVDNEKHTAFIRPGEKDCRILVNGTSIIGETELHHNDRLVFGSTQLWVFQNPKEHGKDKKKYPPITYEYAQEEIAAKCGVKVDAAGGGDMAMLQEDLIDVMPAVEEANSISEELDKRVKFEIILISPKMLGKMQGAKAEGFHDMKSAAPEVCVKMKNLENGTEFIWPKEKFLNRLYLMKEMYNNYEEEEDDWDQPEEKDPFKEDVNQEVNIGTVQLFLQPIAYMVEMKEQLEISDLKGNKCGIMNLEVAPCNKKGKEYTEADDKFVDNPEELVGKNLHFIVKIVNCRGLPNKYTDVHCKYRLYLDSEDTVTDKISLTANPDFNHKKQFDFTPATRQLVDYLNNGSVMIQILGKQFIRKSAVAAKKGMTTKEMLSGDRSLVSKSSRAGGLIQMNGRVVDPQKQSIVVELLLMKKTQARLQQRCDNMKKMLEKAEQLGRSGVSTKVVKSFFNASTNEQINSAVKQLEADHYDDEGYRSASPSSEIAQTSGVCVIL